MSEPQTPEFNAAQIAVYLRSNPSGSTLKAICSDQLGRQRTKVNEHEALERFMDEHADSAGWMNTHKGWRLTDLKQADETKHASNQPTLPDMGPNPNRKIENQRCEDTGQAFRAACVAAHPYEQAKREAKAAFTLACEEENYDSYAFYDPADNHCAYTFNGMKIKITPPSKD